MSRWCRRKLPRRMCWRLKPDGVFLSNGPGDPEPVTYAVEKIRKLARTGADLWDLPGAPALRTGAGRQDFQAEIRASRSNHPVKNLLTSHVEITAQNHGFCVDPDSLPSSDVEITHINLNDQHQRRLCAIARCRSSACSIILRLRRDRTIRIICSRIHRHDEASIGASPGSAAPRTEARQQAEYDAETHRHQENSDHRLGADHHWAGVRVRLFRNAGVQSAARRRL